MCEGCFSVRSSFGYYLCLGQTHRRPKQLFSTLTHDTRQTDFRAICDLCCPCRIPAARDRDLDSDRYDEFGAVVGDDAVEYDFGSDKACCFGANIKLVVDLVSAYGSSSHSS